MAKILDLRRRTSQASVVVVPFGTVASPAIMLSFEDVDRLARSLPSVTVDEGERPAYRVGGRHFAVHRGPRKDAVDPHHAHRQSGRTGNRDQLDRARDDAELALRLATRTRRLPGRAGGDPSRSMRPLTRFQPLVSTADFENLIFLGEGADDTGKPTDINETA